MLDLLNPLSHVLDLLIIPSAITDTAHYYMLYYPEHQFTTSNQLMISTFGVTHQEAISWPPVFLLYRVKSSAS